MKVKDLMEVLGAIMNQDAEIMIASDEEHNTIFEKLDIQNITGETSNDRDIWVLSGLAGSEVEEFD